MCDYSLINDAEHLQDLNQMNDEKRHEVALQAVELGIYKDVFEAKQ